MFDELISVPSRTTEPPAQRRPSPNATPLPPFSCAVPWKYSTDEFGMPLPLSTNVSDVMLAEPLPYKCPPAVTIEFAHPLPALPSLPHGHALAVPSPKQYVVDEYAGPRSRTNRSRHGVMSAGSRLLASLGNATNLASAEIAGFQL